MFVVRFTGKFYKVLCNILRLNCTDSENVGRFSQKGQTHIIEILAPLTLLSSRTDMEGACLKTLPFPTNASSPYYVLACGRSGEFFLSLFLRCFAEMYRVTGRKNSSKKLRTKKGVTNNNESPSSKTQMKQFTKKIPFLS